LKLAYMYNELPGRPDDLMIARELLRRTPCVHFVPQFSRLVLAYN
jgi:hypothetical protein